MCFARAGIAQAGGTMDGLIIKSVLCSLPAIRGNASSSMIDGCILDGCRPRCIKLIVSAPALVGFFLQTSPRPLNVDPAKQPRELHQTRPELDSNLCDR